MTDQNEDVEVLVFGIGPPTKGRIAVDWTMRTRPDLLFSEELRSLTRHQFQLVRLLNHDIWPDGFTYESMQDTNLHPCAAPNLHAITTALAELDPEGEMPGLDPVVLLPQLRALMEPKLGDPLSTFICDKCLEFSTDELDDCPFCGHGCEPLPFQHSGMLKDAP